MKKRLVGLAIAVAAMAAQPVLAGGRHHHHRGHGGMPWAPLVAGAVIGGLAVNAWAQPRPVYTPPGYMLPPPRVIVPQPYMAPPPVYVLPAAPAGYYYDPY